MRSSSLTLSVTSAVSAVVACAVFATVLLTQAKFESHALALVEVRLAIALEEVAEPIRFALGLGLALDEMADLPTVIARAQPDDADRVSVAAFDANGSLVVRVPDAERSSVADLVQVHQDLNDGFGRPAGRLLLSFQADALRTSLQRIADMLRYWGLLIALAGAGLAAPALWLTARRFGASVGAVDGKAADTASTRRLTWQLVAVAGGLLLAGAVVVSATAWRSYEPIVEAELDAQAETLGVGLKRQIDRALEVGVPIDRRRGRVRRGTGAYSGHPIRGCRRRRRQVVVQPRPRRADPHGGTHGRG